jgi:hypothetical protein
MSLYSKRGVSAQKEEVHAAVKNLDQGLFPNAFCKIYPDRFGMVLFAKSMQMVRVPKVFWLIYIGKKQEIFQFGRELPRMLW